MEKIADKNWILTAYNEKAADNTRAISVVNKGHAAPTTAVSESKGSEKVEAKEENVIKSEEARYIAEEDAYKAYEEYYIEEIKEALEMWPEGGITAIFADEYIRENQIRQEYEQRRIVERGNRSGEVLQGARINTSRGVGSRTEGRTVSKGIGNDMLKGEDAVAQGGETRGVTERKVRAERELGVEKGDKGLRDQKEDEEEHNLVGYIILQRRILLMHRRL